MSEAVRIEPIAAFGDNYIWLLTQGAHAVVVDPGDAAPVAAVLDQRHLALDTIVVTHHHADHVGGVAALARNYGARVVGPAGGSYAGVDLGVGEGDSVNLLGHPFLVLEVPGHTLDHLAYWSDALGVVFCGDTLFAGGCGRMFEGTAAQLHTSLTRLAALPGETLVYCAHEYTSANLRFALAVEPENADLRRRYRLCLEQRQQGTPTVPSTIALERATNPFLRCEHPQPRAAAARHDPKAGTDAVDVFATLRQWKNTFAG